MSPMVDGVHYAYSKAGMKMAKRASKKKGKKMKMTSKKEGKHSSGWL